MNDESSQNARPTGIALPFRRYTLTRIAQDLGVSLTTVSRALSGTGRVSEETRLRILRRAEQLQGPVRTVHPAPVMKRILGMFTPWYGQSHGTSTSIASTGQQAAAAVCEEKGYGVVPGTFGNPERLTVGDELIESGGLAGVLLHRTREEEAIARALARRGIRSVFVYRNLEGLGLNYVGVDFAAVMRMALDHCLECGFRELGILCGDLRFPSQGGYHKAFTSRLAREGLDFPAGWSEPVELTEAAGYEAARRMFARHPHPRAVICCSDRLAFGALRALHDSGKRIPRDVAVVTIDGTLAASYTRPSLTAVQVPWAEMFSLAAEFLIRMAEGQSAVEQIGARLRCGLVVRESSVQA